MTTPAITNAVAVRLDGVGVDYGSRTALTGIDLNIPTGQVVGLVGPSGAGKSTLMRVVNGMVAPTTGSATILGVQLSGLNPSRLRTLRRQIGSIHQQLDLVGSLRVVHNVNAGRLGRWSAARSLWSLIRPQGISEVTAALDRVGIGSRVFARTDEISGGEQQRVALARILLQDPPLVLADEPVSNLDPTLARSALEQLCGAVGTDGRTLLISLHDPALAMAFCTRLIGLRSGRMVLDVPTADADAGVFDVLYERAS